MMIIRMLGCRRRTRSTTPALALFVHIIWALRKSLPNVESFGIFVTTRTIIPSQRTTAPTIGFIVPSYPLQLLVQQQQRTQQRPIPTLLDATKNSNQNNNNSSSNNNKNKGFGSNTTTKSTKKNKRKVKKTGNLPSTKATDHNIQATSSPFRSQEDNLIERLQREASKSCLGQVVAESKGNNNNKDVDPFWELMPSLIQSRFPLIQDSELQRIAGLLRYTLNPQLDKVEQELYDPALRPMHDIHAYMPNMGPTQPFYNPELLPLCQELSNEYETILQEYHALLQEMEQTGHDRFQSVTNMNYKSGWKTVVLFYNGHRIEGFPYHVCPTTTKLLESVPLAGRIAGFNRQQPQTGIPRHTDGNNLWLTCQMGLLVPEQRGKQQPQQQQQVGQDQNKNVNHHNNNDMRAYITVGNETRQWEAGQCLLYDTTFWHETFNPHPTQERVVLHIDFFNTLALTQVEIEILQYMYSLREQFMKAEGVAKVEAQIL